ncbi:MFS transporter [Natronosporangium hydrolyticum]|uniref:MFS transporter n=1 Tax=Natronosporangium hydrolyticum TaxID=2811111 RepID=A0A895YIS3_9ACTN|nr:MFS transporter [Natronosporangium hydrolyticum]QSB15932.1 MFS transporter [Natronosporangium hydrolyticum]
MSASGTDPTLRAGRREWLGLGMLALPALLVSMDLTILHLAAPAISADLQPTAAQLLWIIDIYGFLIAGFLITMGTLGDRIGRRRLLLIGAAGFGIASVIAAFSVNAEMLIVARALLGIAGATLAPSTVALIRNMFHDPGQRATAISIWFMAFMTGSAIGPLIGGGLLEMFWWGSTLLVGVPVMVLLVLLGPVLLPEYRAPAPGRMDLTGAVTALIAILSVTYGLKRAAEDGFTMLPVLAMLFGGLVGVMFIQRQRTAAAPLLDLSLFRLRTVSVSVVALTLGAVAVGGIGYLTVQYLQMVAGRSPIMAGLLMVPPLLTGIVTTLLSPVVAKQMRPGVKITLGLAIAAVGLLLVSRAEDGSGVGWVVAGLVLLFGGIMPVLALGVTIVITAAPPERAGAASAITETAQELGIALGIAFLGSITATIYRQQMTDLFPSSQVPTEAEEAASATLGGATGVADQLAPGMLQTAAQAFTDGLQLAAIVASMILAAVAITAGVLLRRTQIPSDSPHP